ncbi:MULTISPECIES: 1,6-anhydro-N-acetylmuramyl-L-alanine amidase AmpD [unclassified Janthinobacterium]|uniref:1,6-anhydro-N-acetylmuramyl-L-alanine amidase AmpD n=1 Tax=unclassified Janthinobacterium TaxID=2610881 RepID=UPI00161276A1|nr:MULTISPECIES: 1,6-anhydro-N-acetylmuramyl-L-alanine amidase AmpD [unclassified Janthinobacterium]MBB5367931.1 AmpD protein [Janthinobacterium sp. K2C7]MBB5379591.1 AmpD protein [Janthinobacterium sp. K2Li3]MBB5386313.1 AmpD protein [Janthinobacterium sp. K2E3]
MKIDESGWCDGAVRYDSPYYDARPEGMEIDLLVIHNISLPGGHFGGPHVSDLFTGRLDYNADPSFADLRGLQVSAHFFVRRDGALVQYVSTDQRAWHAGQSTFDGRPQCNAYSIGIEMEGSDFVPFQPVQYRVLVALTAALARRYGLAHVRGHEHIAPGRKTDPGPFFDWDLYQQSWQLALRGQPALVLTTRVLGFPSKV